LRLRSTGTVRPEDAADLVRWAQEQVDARRIERYALTPASLEDVYIRLVGLEQTADGADQGAARPQVAADPETGSTTGGAE